VDSSGLLLGAALGRSVCVSRYPTCTSVCGRVVGIGAGVSLVSRTVMPMVARSASVVLRKPCMNEVMGGRVPRLAQGKVQPLTKPSIGTRRTLHGGWAVTWRDLTSARHLCAESQSPASDPYPLWVVWLLMQRGRAARSAPLPARKGTPSLVCGLFRAP